VRARISRQPAELINPYGTDLVRLGFFVLVLHTKQHVFQGRKGAFKGPYSPYGRRTVAVKSGHDFPEIRTVRSPYGTAVCAQISRLQLLGFFLYISSTEIEGKR
jgi:hypothetical protein